MADVPIYTSYCKKPSMSELHIHGNVQLQIFYKKGCYPNSCTAHRKFEAEHSLSELQSNFVV